MAADEGGVLDDDTRRTIAAGRATAGDLLVAARSKLRRIFIVFVVGLLGTIYAMRAWIWPQLKADLLAQGAELVVITPFDVILLQAKIGIVVGILMSIPTFLYYGREPLKERGLYPEDGVSSVKLAAIALLSVLLFVGGVVYSYLVFFPVMFDFLANNAISAGLAPTYSIVDWTQFILVLGLSFGLAAQLPLAMTALSAAEIVPYETFRDKWKYAIVVMFGFGALFSPPDPFTQVMWAAPLVALYGFSLYLARFVVGLKRGGSVDLRANVRRNATRLAAAFVLAAGAVYWLFTDGAVAVNRLLASLPAPARPAPFRPDAVLPIDGPAGAALIGGLAGLLAALLVLMYYTRPTVEAGRAGQATELGDDRPGAIDLGPLDADGVRSAPPEAFSELAEEEAVAAAREAMDANDPEKARAILDRFDEAEAAREADEEGADGEEADAAEAGADPDEGPAEGGGDEATGGAVTRASAGILDAITEEETTEEDVGGYYYDIAFVLDSLRSKAFRIFAVFIGVLAGVFYFLYSGGIGAIKRDFLSRLPAVVRPEEINVVTLHPVEALVFEVKISTLLGAVAVLPMLLYYAWPALKERGVASGDRDVFFGWAGAIFGGLVIGSALGYLYVAPAVVSYFVWDALRAEMIIAYRVSNFFWLVFFTTVGIGLWLDIVVTMLLFYRGGLVTFERLRESWRGVTVTVLAFAAIFTPASVLSMILVTIPIMLAYGVGLGILWVYTLPDRLSSRMAARSG